MKPTNTVSNEIWRIHLPIDWRREGDEGKAQVYFVSEDETIGVYLLASIPNVKVSDEDRVAQLAREFGILQRMERSSWVRLQDWLSHESGVVRYGMECLDEAAKYRIVVQRIDSPEFCIRASLHDYVCSDLEGSRAFFKPILESFEFDE